MDRHDREKKHLALPTAVATVYFKVTGRQVDGSGSPQTSNVLCDVAHALSILAPLYTADALSPMPREILAATLIGARFERSARVLVLQDGTELRNLTIQRGDLDAAVELLQSSGIANRWNSDLER
jgi:hypothetical protein